MGEHKDRSDAYLNTTLQWIVTKSYVLQIHRCHPFSVCHPFSEWTLAES